MCSGYPHIGISTESKYIHVYMQFVEAIVAKICNIYVSFMKILTVGIFLTHWLYRLQQLPGPQWIMGPY